MGRVEHRGNDLDLTGKQGNVLTQYHSGLVPSIEAIYIDTDGNVDLLVGLSKEIIKDLATHAVFVGVAAAADKVGRAVSGEADVVELDFIYAELGQLFGDIDVIIPDLPAMGIYPVFSVVLPGTSASFLGKGIFVVFVVKKPFVFKSNQTGDDRNIVFASDTG